MKSSAIYNQSQAWVLGVKEMIEPMLILILAWGLGDVIADLQVTSSTCHAMRNANGYAGTASRSHVKSISAGNRRRQTPTLTPSSMSTRHLNPIITLLLRTLTPILTLTLTPSSS